ncbi:hypothetical protein HELRODRAFT_164083 [Helobdella robusta]|uniref:Endonuclease/exonuclease/phosphatase domain-containing protein n=1 Tax=Helobdella robusta TaxID=6412 RepID=T1EUW5_HELRO|nr:hypothetical protein HELRODRAFT_164083 [Helobdella robusta]ESN94275.1 hypothetical protein HELRODRAFT_164083 [Helobdella robusta]
MLNEKFESIDSRLKTFDSIDIGMKNLQLRLESSGENLKQLEKLDEKLNQSINSLKNDITKSWSDVVKSNSKIVDNEAAYLRNMISTSFSDVVKKDLDVVSKEVISVRRTIEVANEVKARENNIILFNFSEDLDVAKDRGNVLGFLRSPTDESLKDEDILKIFRQDICVLTETWHGSSDDISVKLAMPYGFSFMDYLRPHDPNHGGIIVYFKNVFKVKKIELPVVNSFESLAIKFRCGKKTILLLAVYRPGSVPITPAFFDELTSLLEQISLLADYVILTGDLNVHLEKVHMVFIPIMVWSKYVFRFR